MFVPIKLPNCPQLLKNASRTFKLSFERFETRIIKAPEMAESITEGDVRLAKKVGDLVMQDEVVLEIETDKTSVYVTAPAKGIITEILVKDGDSIKPGQDAFKIKLEGMMIVLI